MGPLHLSLAGLVGLFERVTEVFIVVLRADDFEGGGERDGAVLRRLDQALFALFQKEDDVADVFFRQTRLGDNVVIGVIPRQQELDVG